MTNVVHNGRTTERVAGTNDDLEAVFAEAGAKAVERDGFALIVGGRRFEVWPARFTYRQKMKLHDHTGMTLEVASTMRSTAPMEALAVLVFASMFQESGATPNLDGIIAWLRGVLEESEDDVPVVWETLSHDEAVADDPLEPSGSSS